MARLPRALTVDPAGASAERARLRVQIAEERGTSPFDSSVVREAARRFGLQLEAEIEAKIGKRLHVSRLPSEDVPGDPLIAVLAAARRIRGRGRFGDRKVFIAALWERVAPRIRMSRAEFGRWLLAQHRAGRIVLARADLVAAMPPDLVERSETTIDELGATFHFVVTDPVP